MIKLFWKKKVLSLLNGFFLCHNQPRQQAKKLKNNNLKNNVMASICVKKCNAMVSFSKKAKDVTFFSDFIIIIINISRIYIIYYAGQQSWHWRLNGCSLSQLIVRTSLACKNLIGHTSSIKLFHAHLTSAKSLAASHFNPMSNSFIFIKEIQVVRCLPLRIFVGLREYWSAILAGVSSERQKRWPNQLRSPTRYYLRPRNLPYDNVDSVIGGDNWPFDTENRNSQQPSLGRVYRIFECFRQCPGLAIVQKYIAHITVKGSDFYLNAYVSEENLFHRVQDIHCKYFSLLYILFSI